MKITNQITIHLKRWNTSINYKSPDPEDIRNYAIFIEDEDDERIFADKLLEKFPDITEITIQVGNEATIYER